MKDVTTIQIKKSLLNELKDIREHPHQTYNELIARLIVIFKKVVMSNQYDEFLHKIQQQKMNELWDNKSDEAWNDV